MLQSKDELKAYIKRQLGSGVNKIEVTDPQVEDCIENAIGYFEREVDGGVEDKIYILPLVTGIQNYNLDQEVMAISEVIYADINSSDILSQMNQFRIDVATPMHTAGNVNLNMTGYIIGIQYMNTINQFLKEGVTFGFNAVTKKLTIHETVKSDGVVAMTVLYSTRNTPNMWNNDFIKEYSTALTMRQWGINLTKYKGAALLGGMELNGDGMLSLAQAEIDRLRAELIDKHTSPLGLWVG